MSRLVKLENRLFCEAEKLSMYKDAVGQFLKDGHAGDLDERDINVGTKINYLPYHPVVRKDS